MIEIAPEILVALTFFPSGVSLGLNVFFYSSFNNDSSHHLYWSHVVGVSSAAVTALIIAIPKFYNKLLRFDQLYLLMVATVSFTVSGFIFQYYENAAFLIAPIGHGITWVAGLSYVLFRQPKFQRKLVVLGLCHVFYFAGAAAVAHVLNNLVRDSSTSSFKMGWLLIIPSATILALLLVEEVLNATKSINYKRSLFPAINNAAFDKTLYATRDEIIKLLSSAPKPGTTEQDAAPCDLGFWTQHLTHVAQGHPFYVTISSQNCASGNLLLTKIYGYMIFSHVILISASQSSVELVATTGSYFIMWITALGSLTGIILNAFLNMRHTFLVGSTLQILSLTTMIMITDEYRAILFWIYYFCLGATYQIATIALLTTARFKYTELMIFGGFFIETFFICIVQSLWMADKELLSLDTQEDTLRVHALAIVTATTILMLIIAVNLPDLRNKTLIEIRNHLLGIRISSASLPSVTQYPVFVDCNIQPPPIYLYSPPPKEATPITDGILRPNVADERLTAMPSSPVFVNEGFDYDSLQSRIILPRVTSNYYSKTN